MKINSLQTNVYTKNSKPSFGVKFTPKAEEVLYKTGEYYLFNYGEESDRFTQFKNCVNSFKKLCPNLTMDLFRGWSVNKRPVMKSVLYDAHGKLCREFEFFDDSPVSDKRFCTDSMFVLSDNLKLVDTEIKEQNNPGYGKALLDKIIK